MWLFKYLQQRMSSKKNIFLILAHLQGGILSYPIGLEV